MSGAISGFYCLSKDLLIKIICHISADKDKEISELKQYKMNYDNLILKAKNTEQYAGKCSVCKFDIIDSFEAYIYCELCDSAYHNCCVNYCPYCHGCATCLVTFCNTCDNCQSCCHC